MRFCLSSNRNGRVILDTRMHGKPIDTFDAEPEHEGGIAIRSAWQVARERVSDCPYRHEPGHGYFLQGNA